MSAAWNSPEAVQQAYRAACWLDVAAHKPGNVSEASPGHGMTARDFHLSAAVTAGVLTRRGLGLGEAIYRAVAVTRLRVGFNTNLGILLLCAPLAQAVMASESPSGIRATLKGRLAATTRMDSARVFEAIRLARPGGLGVSERHDVRAAPRISLAGAMSYAAHRDRIALQYVTDFQDIFETALPRLRSLQATCSGDCAAVTGLFLHLLAGFPDSHVARKHGPEKAEEVMRWAGEARQTLGPSLGPQDRRYLQELDTRLKAEDINPGTTADLTVATLFLDGLLTQPTTSRGSGFGVNAHCRTARPGARAESFSIANLGDKDYESCPQDNGG